MIVLPCMTRNVTYPRNYVNGDEYHDPSLERYLQSEQYKQKQRLLDEKIGRLYNYGHDQELNKKVIPKVGGRGSLDYSLVDDSFKTATITSEGLRKGNYISKRIKDLSNMPLEIYLYSLDIPYSTDGPVTRDLYIAREQSVDPVACEVSATGVRDSKLEIREKLKMRVIGWSHSHRGMNLSFSYSEGNEHSDAENTINILQLHGFKKRICIRDPMIRGKGYKGVEYEVRYTPALVFNVGNAPQPFVAIAVEYTRRYDGKKVFHINEHCRLMVIEENNGIDMDPASIDRQILERVYYNGRRLGEIRGIHDKTEPLKANVRTSLTGVVKPLEGIYAQLEQRFTLRNRRLRALCRGLKLQYNTLRTKQEQSREALNALTTRIEKLEALTSHSYVKRFISKLKKMY